VQEAKTMQQAERKQQARQSSGWIWQAVTGVLLIVIVLLHMIFQHFQEGLLSASQVVAHVADPAIFVLEILFVLAVTYHALLGIKAVIFDLQLSDSARRKVSMGLTVLGVVTVVYGVILAFLIRSAPV
jgi:succinate dehydrogenase hydrophobic anchor subunit